MSSLNNGIVYSYISITQSDPEEKARPVEQNHNTLAMVSTRQDMVSVWPPMYHPSGVQPSITPVMNMTVEQTANWIWTLGGFYRWPDAHTDTYAKSFKWNNIHGALLKELRAEHLEWLKINCQEHRRNLVTAIEYVFPELRLESSLEMPWSNTGVGTIEPSYGSMVDGGKHSLEPDWRSTNSYLVSTETRDTVEPEHLLNSDSMSESCRSWWSGRGTVNEGCFRTMTESEDDARSDLRTFRSAIPFRCTKLLLKPQNDLFVKDEFTIESISARFQKENICVKVLRYKDKPWTYILKFSNFQQAEEVLLRADQLGYKLKKKRPPRPSTKNPQKFKVMAKLDIRSRKKEDKTPIIGVLEEGIIVRVNKLDGRYARLFEETESGQIIIKGWVTLHTIDGKPLLTQLEDL